MIEFPDEAFAEWTTVEQAENADTNLRKRLAHDTLVERETGRLRVRKDAETLLQQELDADLTPVLEMMTLDNYQANPALAPSDLIEGVVKDDGLCIVIGPSGSGKSTQALQMIHSLATGSDWFGQPAQKLTGGFGVLSYDMDAALVMDWMSGFPKLDPTRVVAVNAHKRGNPLNVPPMRAKIAETWKAMNVEVVVLDSFSASFFGMDQNDAAATMAHYRDLKLFALTEVGARALVIISHSTDSNPHKARGSTVHHDVADSIVSLEVNTATKVRSLTMVKYRAARGQVEMDPVIITAPDATTHLCDIDTGAMSMAGMNLPASAAASVFPPLPEPENDPDTTQDEEDI